MARYARFLVSVITVLSTTATAGADDVTSASYDFSKGNLPGFPPSGSWTSVENWSPVICSVDGPSGCIVKDYPGRLNGRMYDVTLTLPPMMMPPATMDLGVTVSLSKLTIGSNVVLNAQAALGMNSYETDEITGELSVKTALLSNDGVINISGSVYSNTGMVFEGGGDYHLLGGAVTAAGGFANDARLRGLGTVTGSSIVNQGLIDADFAGGVLRVDVGSLLANDLPAARNLGTLRATNGATLRIARSGASGFLDNSNGVVEAGADSRVEIQASLRGGDLQGAGTIAYSGTGFLEDFRNFGTLRLVPGANATAYGASGGTIVNDGQIELAVDPGVIPPTRYNVDGHVTIGGSGSLILRGAKSQILGQGADARLRIGAGALVRGAGLIGTNGGSEALALLDNAGVIRANVAGQALLLRGRGLDGVADLVNDGMLEAVDGGVLEIRSSDVFNHGKILARAGSLVDVNAARVAGGVFDTVDTGVVKIRANSTLRDITNRGTLAVEYGELAGTIENDGSMQLDYVPAAGSYAGLGIAGEVLLTGTGVLALQAKAGDVNSARIRSSSGGVVTNDVAHTIRGVGSIGYEGALGLRNKGLIEAGAGGELVLLADAARGGLINEGRLRAAAGGTLRVAQNLIGYDAATRTLSDGRYEAQGTIRLPTGAGIVRNGADIVLDGAASRIYAGATGSIDALGAFAENLASAGFSVLNGRDFALGTFTNAGSVRIGVGSTLTAASYTQHAGMTQIDGKLLVLGELDVEGGQLIGSGQIAGNLFNGGQLSPGNSPGSLVVDGDYRQIGTLLAEIGAADHDRLVVTGTAALGGTLEVKLWSTPGTASYVPTSGASFDLVFADTLLGMFASVKLPATAGITWKLHYLADAGGGVDVVRLTASAVPLPQAFGLFLIASGLLMRGCRRGI